MQNDHIFFHFSLIWAVTCSEHDQHYKQIFTHTLFLSLTFLCLKYLNFKNCYAVPCHEINQHCGAQRRVVLGLCLLSDSLWHEGRDMKACPRILRGQKANGYLNSCRSQALKHVIPVDKLPTEGLAPTVMKLLCREALHPWWGGGAPLGMGWIVQNKNQTKNHQLFFKRNSPKGNRVEMGVHVFMVPGPTINLAVLR